MIESLIESPQQAATFVLIGIVGYFVTLIVYRLTLHPLAKYPGPFLAKITSWYDAYQGFSGHRHQDQFRCQQKYGNVFRYGPNFLIMQTPEALSEIYAHGKQRPIRKAENYRMNYDHGSVSTAFMIEKDEHLSHRRVLSHAFNEHALKEQEPLMIEQIDKWIAMLGAGSSADSKGWSSPKNMSDYANYLTLDVLGSLCFGKAFGLLDGKLRDIFPEVLYGRTLQFQTLGNTSTPRLFKWLQEHTPLERWLVPNTASGFAAFTNFVINAAKERNIAQADLKKSGTPARPDFIHYLQDAKDPVTGKAYTPLQMNTELRLLVGAGSDTTSTTIAATLYYLVRNPEIMKKLQTELRSNFSSLDDIVVGPNSNNCRYLRAVIEETLRVNPPIPSALKRVTEAPMVIGDIALPANTEVACAAWGIQHDDKFFPDATTYKPERWLHGVSSKEELDHMKSMFTPFSQGIRACVGKNMAYNELTVALGKLFWLYEARLVPGDTTGTGTDGFYNQSDRFISMKDGPIVQFRKRTDI